MDFHINTQYKKYSINFDLNQKELWNHGFLKGTELNNNFWLVFVWLGFTLLVGIGLVGVYYLAMFILNLENKNIKKTTK